MSPVWLDIGNRPINQPLQVVKESFYLQVLIFQEVILVIIVELRTPAMPVGVGGGKERGGFHLN